MQTQAIHRQGISTGDYSCMALRTEEIGADFVCLLSHCTAGVTGIHHEGSAASNVRAFTHVVVLWRVV